MPALYAVKAGSNMAGGVGRKTRDIDPPEIVAAFRRPDHWLSRPHAARKEEIHPLDVGASMQNVNQRQIVGHDHDTDFLASSPGKVRGGWLTAIEVCSDQTIRPLVPPHVPTAKQ
jgi:hypothetical protein